MHLSYLANTYSYNYKHFPCIIHKNKHIVITKSDKGNAVVILDQKIYNNAIQEIISGTSKFEKLSEDPTLKRNASLQRFLPKLMQKKFV